MVVKHFFSIIIYSSLIQNIFLEYHLFAIVYIVFLMFLIMQRQYLYAMVDHCYLGNIKMISNKKTYGIDT